MEYYTLEEQLDLVASLLSRWICPEFEVSKRLVWELCFSNQCFANEFCHYLNELTPGLICEEEFENLPAEPILPIIEPINNYKDSRIFCVFTDQLSNYIDQLISKMETILRSTNRADMTKSKAFIADLSQQHLIRLASYTPFCMPPTPSHIDQWRKSMPQHEWFKLRG
ncbi:hypothetical protein [Endozoicomonas sp.]|uniref:hypothetical protein n=1 Tax=Endozoicomonas sp. TaxID=1892382 RepID=UPI003AF64479